MAPQFPHDSCRLGARLGRGEEGGGDVVVEDERHELVLDEGEEGGDHDGDPRGEDSWQLEGGRRGGGVSMSV